jgi:Flp pilus assembly protein TadD
MRNHKLMALLWLLGALALQPVGNAQPRQDVPDPAQWKLREANECLKKQDCDCAIPALERAVELYSGYVEALVALGYCYYQKGELDKAIKSSTTVLGLTKREPMAFLTLAMSHEQKGSYELAASNYEAALKLKKDDLVTRIGLARSYERLGRKPQAISEYESVLAAHPQSIPVMTSLSQLYLDAGRPKDAEKVLNGILKIDPGSPAALMRLGSLYKETKQWGKAVEALQSVLKIDYNQPIIHMRLGETYTSWGKAEMARTHFAVAAELDPNYISAKKALADLIMADAKAKPADHDEALKLYGDVIAEGESDYFESATLAKIGLLHKRGQQDLAADAAEAALQHNPNNATVVQLVARRRLQTGQRGEALELGRRWTELEPNSAEAWSLRGAIELTNGDVAAARGSLQTASGLDPKNVSAMLNLAYLEGQDGNTEQAVRRLQQVLSSRPGSVAALNNLALLQMEDKPAAAVPSLKKAMELRPDDGTVKNNLAVALARDGKNKEARELLQALTTADPAVHEWRRNLAILLSAEGNFAGVVAQLKPMAEAGSDDYVVWRLLADALHRQRDFSGAEAAYRKALELAGNEAARRVAVLYNLGTTLLALERRPRAQDALGEAVKLSPNLAEAHNNLGVLSFQSGRQDDARQAFRAAFRLKPAERNFLLNLANAGEVMTAEDFARAESVSATDRSAAESRVTDTLLAGGYAALAAKRYPEALDSLKKAKAAGVVSAELEAAIGVALIRTQRFDEAKVHLSEALRLAPSSADVLLNMALLHDVHYKQSSEAIQYYERYLGVSPDPKISRYLERMKRFQPAQPS